MSKQRPKTENQAAASDEPNKDDGSVTPAMSPELVKNIYADAIERHLEMQKMARANLPNIEPALSTARKAAEQLGQAMAQPGLHRAAEALLETQRKIQKSFEPLAGQFKQLAEMSNQLGKIVNPIQNNPAMAKLADAVRMRQEIEDRTQSLFKNLDVSIFTRPETKEIVVTRPVPDQQVVSQEQYEEDIIKVAKLAAHEVFNEAERRGTNRYLREGEIVGVKLPENTTWSDLNIKFMDGDTVYITTEIDPTATPSMRTFKEMGFADHRRKEMPNKQWEFLETLAESHGIVTLGNTKANYYNKKKKQLLAQALSKYFEIEGDPFEPYWREHGYKIKINLLPALGNGQEIERDDIMVGADDPR
jgi:hypothetical protein